MHSIAYFGICVVSLAGCATKYVVLDKLENYVIASLLHPVENVASCIASTKYGIEIPAYSFPCNTGPVWMPPGGNVELFFNAANSRDLKIPVAGMNIDMQLVNTDGQLVPSADGEISPRRANSGEDGGNSEKITVTISKPGVYLIRMDYIDRGSKGFGYSAPIIVQTK
jgi:hypothetical protein